MKYYNFDSDYAIAKQSEDAVKAYYHNYYKQTFPTTYLNCGFVRGVVKQRKFGDLQFLFNDKDIHIEVKTDRALDKSSNNVIVEYWAHLPKDDLNHSARKKGWFQGYEKVDAIVFHPQYNSYAYLFPYPAFKQYILDNKDGFETFVLNNSKKRSAGWKVDINELMNNVKGAKTITL